MSDIEFFGHNPALLSDPREGVKRLYLNELTGVLELMDQDRNVQAVPYVGADNVLRGPSGPVSVGGATSLPLWRKKLATDPANALILLNGDSTTDFTTTSQWMTKTLQVVHTAPGYPLYGMQAANIVPLGYNGMSLATWLADPTKLAALVAAAAGFANPLVIASWGLNDVRLGGTSLTQMIALLTTYVKVVTAAIPGVSILLRMPNPMLTTNVGGNNFVQDAQGNINPAGAAQSYSTLLRNAYLAFKDAGGNVDMIDIQTVVFGTLCRSTSPIMTDQLHPTGSSVMGNNTPTSGGYNGIANALAARIGIPSTGVVLDTSQYLTSRSDFAVADGGNGYIDIGARTPNGPQGAQYPISTADVLFIPGFDSPVSLVGCTFDRPFGSNFRVHKGVDFTAARGLTCWIGSPHPDATTGDRQIVAVDVPSIAAGAYGSVSVTVTGARSGELSEATNIVCTLASAIATSGLVYLGGVVTANDTVKLNFYNPTGSAIDAASASCAFWVVR